jgi:hypothetical protein
MKLKFIDENADKVNLMEFTGTELTDSSTANSMTIVPALTCSSTLTASGIQSNGNILMSAGSELRLNGAQFASTDLADSASIVNTSATAQTKTGNLTVSNTFRAGDLELSDANHQIQIDTDGHMLFGIPTGDEYRFIIGGSDAVVISSSAMSIAGNTVATQQYVTTTLTSAEAAASTLSLVQANPLTLAQTLTCSGNLVSNAAATFAGSATFNAAVNVASTSDITRTENATATNYLDKVKEQVTSYHRMVTLPSSAFVASGTYKLFDTNDEFDVYEFGVRKGTDTINLDDTAFHKSAFKMLLSFQGYSS